MRQKYVSRLTDKQLLDLHKLCQIQDITDEVECSSDEDGCSVVFYEGSKEVDGTTHYLYTSYDYFDFERPNCHDAGNAPCDMEMYYGFMIGVFGEAYLLDLIKHKLRVSDKFAATHLSLIAAAPDERFLNDALQDNSINQADLELRERFAGIL